MAKKKTQADGTIRDRVKELRRVRAGDLRPSPKNWRTHPKAQADALAGVLAEIGYADALLAREVDGGLELIDGHLRADTTPDAVVPVLVLDVTEAEADKLLATLDPLAAMAGADSAKLDELLRGVSADSEALQTLLDGLKDEHGLQGNPAGEGGMPPGLSLSERFLVPPFSVLDARQGYWQERKREWLALGIQSELGRTADLIPGGASSVDAGRSPMQERASPGGSRRPAASLGDDGKTRRGDGRGRASDPGQSSGQDLMRGEHVVGGASPYGAYGKDDDTSRRNAAARPQTGTSIFDPVLCELAYRWFCPPAGHVLDPFAGGSVRGIVAARLGRKYTGIDLRPEQLAANREQAKAITPDNPPTWVEGDSADAAALAPGEYDLVFSCPPYADLERYSDDPRDLSAMDYPAFLAAYRRVIAAACRMLRDDRFAAFVVGDVRDPKGMYRDFVSGTIDAFRAAGLALYNEAVLVTAVGSLPLRVGKQFSVSRKLGKTHQNVLVFVKGDPRKATDACGAVEVNLEVITGAEGFDAGGD
jgi:hypothetical protein